MLYYHTKYVLRKQALKKKKPSQEDVLQWEFGLFDEMGLTPRGAKPKDRFSKFRQLKMTERDFANHGLDRQGRTAAKRPPLKELAEEAIDRAVTNAILLDLPRSAAAERFQAWCLENVVGDS